jgi:hypothetical protein
VNRGSPPPYRRMALIPYQALTALLFSVIVIVVATHGGNIPHVSEDNVNRDWVTISDATTLLGVHRNTVMKLVKAGIYEGEEANTSSGPTWLITRDSLTNTLADTTLTRAREVSAEKEKRQRLVQSGTEYWKAQFEFHKNLMTLCLATIAAFGALLSGVFTDPTTWTGLSTADGPEWLRLAWLRPILIFTALPSFLGALAFALMASRVARENIWLIKDALTEEYLSDLSRRYSAASGSAQGLFAFGLFQVGFFIGGHGDTGLPFKWMLTVVLGVTSLVCVFVGIVLFLRWRKFNSVSENEGSRKLGEHR